MEEPKILCFTWNTESNRICETLDEKQKEYSRSGFINKFIKQDCNIMDFWPNLQDRITKSNPDILVISFQEDAKPGSHAHSTLFVNLLNSMGYTLVKREKLIGIGETTIHGLYRADIVNRGLRISVYVRSELRDFISDATTKCYVESVFRNKGAIAVYLTVQLAGGISTTLVIINAHLPFDAASVADSKALEDPLIRQNGVMTQNIFFNNFYRYFIHDSESIPEHVILMGDLNYRMSPFVNWSARETGRALLSASPTQLRNYVLAHDELTQQMAKNNIYELSEGIRGEGFRGKGPQFFPTCKMKHDRDTNVNTPVGIDMYDFGDHDELVPSYCDRILYTSYVDDDYELQCINYQRFDLFMTKKSDHAAVIGVYRLYRTF